MRFIKKEERAMKKVIIFRGCPGSGKTTALKRDYPSAFVCSAVNYHTDHLGNYKFFPKGISESHKYCQNAFLAALQNSLPLVAVDNTNVRFWEFEWYIDTAEKHGYSVEVFRLKTDDPIAAARRNVHGVSEEVVMRMYNNMEDYPGEIFI
ncbi:MAG: AAA family ATPase [Candidatus Moraniibacteriota bacterium]